ncbi:Coq4 family protein [uncultured Dokdonia sp.]|uniref:Coq4 family protein n=1 Tax=uncultured Dokdonia sp. TaxID=575653 RepID=UPI002632204C|nr:Coq4 family protein [uncultured Dokdonia sp.]
MNTLRYILLERLYEWSKIPYRFLFKKEAPWDISVKDLLKYPLESLGYHLGCFLLQHHFTPEPQLEDHDIYHVLTGSGITVPDEIAMQFYLFGNGKRSMYLFMVLTLGTFLFPDHIKQFWNAYKKGRKAHAFYHLNFLKLLQQPLTKLQYTFKITTL